MDERARTLFKTLVERYINDGQPVGSRTLSKTSGIDLSPATIRNVMADLEEMGLITSPHTSAGRVPTAQGYRLFVDTMLTTKQPDPHTIQKIQQQIDLPTQGHPKEILASAAHTLSGLSQFAGIVITPKRHISIRHIDFLKLAPRRILVIIVSLDGDVQNRIIHTTNDHPQHELTQAANYINTHFTGQPFEDVRQHLEGEIETLRTEIVDLMRSAVNASTNHNTNQEEQILLSGQRNLLEVNDLAKDLHSLRKLFQTFEQKTQWLQLLDVSDKAQGIRIYIGGESHTLPIDELSIITAPYEIDGQIVGKLGVIGPTRMAYDRMIQIVDITSKLVNNILSNPSDKTPDY